MSCDGVLDEDPIAPIRIEHPCEEIHQDGELGERYNYLLYTFAAGDGRIIAKAYFDTIDSVTIFPQRHVAADGTVGVAISAPDFMRDVMSYLGRRYRDVHVFNPGGKAAT